MPTYHVIDTRVVRDSVVCRRRHRRRRAAAVVGRAARERLWPGRRARGRGRVRRPELCVGPRAAQGRADADQDRRRLGHAAARRARRLRAQADVRAGEEVRRGQAAAAGGGRQRGVHVRGTGQRVQAPGGGHPQEDARGNAARHVRF